MAVGLLIIAHSPLGSALKECAKHILGDTETQRLQTLLIKDIPHCIDRALVLEELKQTVQNYAQDGMIILTDIIGATPSNLAHELLTLPYVRVISGVNLPALLCAITHQDKPINQLMTMIEGAARSSISARIGQQN